ncbi:MAG: hypothetical protein JZU55_02770 [Afipia sp.]|nr:hypothetical protein [Afipia sp.]
MNLGQFIETLARAPSGAEVHIDALSLSPTKFSSYRGSYDHLALGWAEDGSCVVSDLLAAARACVGATFEGYKGGDYVMGNNTPIYISNYGRVGNLVISGLEIGDRYVEIQTEKIS